MKHGWEYKKLGEICQIVTGSTPKTSVQEYWGGKYPWVTPAELKGDVFIDDTERHITDEAVAHTNVTLLPIGTVLLSSRAPIGKVAITTREMYCNQGFKNLICSDTIFNKYLYFWLKGKTDYLNSLGRGATFKEISKSIVENIQIPLPPIQSQQYIVSELDKINELICLKKEQLKDYDNLAQSIFYEMFGDPVVNEKGWEVKKLREVCECITDGDHMPPPKSDTGIPFVTIGNVNKASRQIDFDNTYFVPRDYFDNIPNIKKPRRGDVLYTVTGSYGIPIIINYDKEFCFQRHIGLLRPKDFMSPVFLCMWALNDRTKGQADMVATGIAQKTVSLKSLRNFAIILPPLPLQQAFAQRIELIEKQKAEIQSTIADLETLLASRMQYWFFGF